MFADKEFDVPVTGDGTKANPYSVAEAMANQGAKDKFWVKGFIVGSYNNGSKFGIDNPSEFNVNIADNKDATIGADVINVQLTTTKDIRATFNLINNPEMFKAEVLFYGNLVEYNKLPGLKNTSDFEILSKAPLFTADNTPITFTSSLELTRTIAITTNDTQAWTATSSDATWLTVAPASGTGSGAIMLTATENTDSSTGRAATVTLIPTDNAELAPIVIDVTQGKFLPLIDVDPTALNFTTASGNKTLIVNANTPWTASATIVDGAPDWLTIEVNAASGTNNGIVTATAKENTTFAARSATINITDNDGISIDVSVTQDAVIPYIDFIPTFLSLEQVGGTEIINVTANVTWSAEVNPEATSWLTLTSTTETITVVATENTLDVPRTATITITCDEGVTETIDVTQAGAFAVVRDGLTKATAFNVDDVIKGATGSDVWVKGYVVGAFINNKPDFTASGTSNIMIADSADELGGANVIPVRVASGDRDPLCKAETVKKQVFLKGTLGSYFSRAGITKLNEYEIIE